MPVEHIEFLNCGGLIRERVRCSFCGNPFVTRPADVKLGKVNSCGCVRKANAAAAARVALSKTVTVAGARLTAKEISFVAGISREQAAKRIRRFRGDIRQLLAPSHRGSPDRTDVPAALPGRGGK